MERMLNSEPKFAGNYEEHRTEERNGQDNVVLHVGYPLHSEFGYSLVSNDLLFDQKKKRSLSKTRKTADNDLEQNEENKKWWKIGVHIRESGEFNTVQKRLGMDFSVNSSNPCILCFLFSEERPCET